ncbi:MAG TPA: helicase C-terminal domain-containing protein [bacterium]|jgi:predicted DnaQ family exonuclease/DinG family helicase
MTAPAFEPGTAESGAAGWLDKLGLSSYVAIDLETTGLDSSVNQIIEVGAVRFRNGVPDSEFRSFVRADRPLDQFIIELTGITDKDLTGAPAFADIANDLLDFIGTDPLVGQNVEFDLGFLRAAGENLLPRTQGDRLAFFQARVLDTALLSRTFWAEFPSFSLASLCRAFGVQLVQAHRALDDARATGEVLARMMQSLPSRVWEELARELNWLVSGTTHRSRFFFSALEEVTTGLGRPEFPQISDGEEDEEPAATPDLDQLFGKDGVFEKKLPFFRFRPMQLELAKAAEASFDHNKILLAEAPTGVGKSLAYLAPALRWVMADPEASRQVIVSSHTKVLQEQLFRKDMREIHTALGRGFRAAVLKGRANYLCKRRLRSLVRESRERLTDVDRMNLMPLLRWSELTATGDISEISGFNIRTLPFLWTQVASDSLACAGSACGAAKGDFYRVAQERAAKAHVLFVNHALLVSDLPRFTGGFKKLVLDEAHQIERAMVGAMTLEISPALFRNMLSRLVDERTSRGLLGAVSAKLKKSEKSSKVEGATPLLSQVRGLYATSRQAFGYLADQLVRMLSENDRASKQRFHVGQRIHDEICRALGPFLTDWSEFSSALKKFTLELSDLRGDDKLAPETLVELRSACDGVEQIREQLAHMLREDDPNAVTWAEFGRSPQHNWCALYAAPVSVGKIMAKVFWPSVESVVLTSATLTVGGKFDVLKSSLGLESLPPERLSESILSSPFRLSEQMRTFVPTYLPAPRAGDGGHSDATVDLIAKLVERFPRGTLILSTSNVLVDKLTTALNPVARKANRRLLSQGASGSLAEMVAEFRKQGNAILVGAASFWEGIDVVGDALQILIVTRIPFDVPTDPWVAARSEALTDAGRDAFSEYSLPVSALRLKQGVGRLIRHPQDRGIAIITDPRLFKSRYGRVIRESLPSAAIAVASESELFQETERFFGA